MSTFTTFRDRNQNVPCDYVGDPVIVTVPTTADPASIVTADASAYLVDFALVFSATAHFEVVAVACSAGATYGFLTRRPIDLIAAHAAGLSPEQYQSNVRTTAIAATSAGFAGFVPTTAPTFGASWWTNQGGDRPRLYGFRCRGALADLDDASVADMVADHMAWVARLRALRETLVSRAVAGPDDPDGVSTFTLHLGGRRA